MMMGVMSISIGLVAEIVVRTYYESQNKRIYHTRELINMDATSLRPGI
jgi:dolichol-phosphate mannosyltransferase